MGVGFLLRVDSNSGRLHGCKRRHGLMITPLNHLPGTRAMRRRQFYSANGIVSKNRATISLKKMVMLGEPEALDKQWSARDKRMPIYANGKQMKRGVFLCKCFKWLFTEEDLTVYRILFFGSKNMQKRIWGQEEDLTGKSLAYFVDWDQICKDIGKQLICDQRTINLLRAWSPLIIEHW
ncbi:hypothetical protein LXL04_017060 [Taraxacum kok-saghyz]